MSWLLPGDDGCSTTNVFYSTTSNHNNIRLLDTHSTRGTSIDCSSHFQMNIKVAYYSNIFHRYRHSCIVNVLQIFKLSPSDIFFWNSCPLLYDHETSVSPTNKLLYDEIHPSPQQLSFLSYCKLLIKDFTPE